MLYSSALICVVVTSRTGMANIQDIFAMKQMRIRYLAHSAGNLRGGPEVCLFAFHCQLLGSAGPRMHMNMIEVPCTAACIGGIPTYEAGILRVDRLPSRVCSAGNHLPPEHLHAQLRTHPDFLGILEPRDVQIEMCRPLSSSTIRLQHKSRI